MIGKRIKVLICINNLYVGGAQRQLQNQLPYFDQEKFEISVISFDAEEERTSTNIVFPPHIAYQHIRMRNLWDMFGWVRSFKEIKKLRPDVIMTSLFWANTIGRAMGILLRVPTIARYHNTIGYTSCLQKRIDTFLSHYTKYFVSVSSEVATFMIRELPTIRSRMHVIPNGIDLSKLNEEKSIECRNRITAELNVESDATLLLTVGRLVRQKNHSLMLDGLAAIKEHYPKIMLCIVGEGGNLQELKGQAARLGIASNVRFIGHQDNVHPYYEAADVYISTSLVEGMSNTQLEALAHGLPIITTETGGVKELVEEGRNGFMIKEYTSSAVCAAFERFVAADKTALRDASLSRAAQFDIRNTVTQYEKLWLQAV